jgi:hypothetical protein
MIWKAVLPLCKALLFEARRAAAGLIASTVTDRK